MRQGWPILLVGLCLLANSLTIATLPQHGRHGLQDVDGMFRTKVYDITNTKALIFLAEYDPFIRKAWNKADLLEGARRLSTHRREQAAGADDTELAALLASITPLLPTTGLLAIRGAYTNDVSRVGEGLNSDQRKGGCVALVQTGGPKSKEFD